MLAVSLQRSFPLQSKSYLLLNTSHGQSTEDEILRKQEATSLKILDKTEQETKQQWSKEESREEVKQHYNPNCLNWQRARFLCF